MPLVLSVQTSKLEACVLPVFLSPRNVLPLLFPGAWRLLAREHFRFFFPLSLQEEVVAASIKDTRAL